MCAVHGCSKPLFTPLIKWGREQKVCRRHYYARMSGRVGSNWKRDIHNFHRKGACERCGKSAFQFGQEIQSYWPAESRLTRARDIVKLGMQVLQGDHINGRHISRAHHAENIMTLCSNCHHVKTIASGDFVPVMHR